MDWPSTDAAAFLRRILGPSNPRPTSSAVEVHVGYITRAHATPRVLGCIKRSWPYSIKGNRNRDPIPGRQDLASEDAKLLRPTLVGA